MHFNKLLYGLVLCSSVVCAMEVQIFQAVAAGDIIALEALIGARGKVDPGYNLDMRSFDLFGTTPLICAVLNDQQEMIKWLVDSGADLEATDRNGETPLITAVRCNCSRSIPLLVSLGAKEHVEDSVGQSAWEYAQVNSDYASVLTKALKERFIQKYDPRHGSLPLALLNRSRMP